MDANGKNQQGHWTLRWVAETGSTNADLLAEGAAGAPDRTVLRADHQTAGRGRLDREWVDTPGRNLLVSFLFRTVPSHPHVLTQAVALAARDVARLLGVAADMKWPNDLLVGNEKLAGVLAQSGPFVGDRPSFVVVGIGVNIGSAPDGATCVARHSDRDIDAQDFLEAMLPLVDAFLTLDDDARHAVYRESLATIGTVVRAQLPDGNELTGRALDVTADGRLVVLDECAVTHRLDTADVVHLRPAG